MEVPNISRVLPLTIHSWRRGFESRRLTNDLLGEGTICTLVSDILRIFLKRSSQPVSESNVALLSKVSAIFAPFLTNCQKVRYRSLV